MLRPKNVKEPEAPRPLPLSRCLAKTWERGGQILPGRLVEEHCRIAGAAAEEYLRRLCEAWPAAELIIPPHAAKAPRVHDAGKLCPTFQKKIRMKLPQEQCQELASINFEYENSWGKHAAVSRSSILAYGGSEALAQILGRHHGGKVTIKPDDCLHFGGPAWADMRHGLIDKLLDGDELPAPIGKCQFLLTGGITILGDWLASGEIFDNPSLDWQPLVNEALDRAGFIFPKVKPALTFADVFGFKPNACQEAMMEAVTGPGIYVLEAPMGMGKTEAALYAAYTLLQRKAVCGIYFALPTQLTSNRMHERMDSFLSSILTKAAGTALAHGGAWLKRYMDQQMGREAAPGGEWFLHSRRAILAPFAAGTVDQALMAVIATPWAPLRFLGMAGKAVILDEIHSYDSYTSKLLEELVKLLSEAGATVIILSATLTQSGRSTILSGNGNDSCSGAASSYPLLTAAPNNSAAVFIPIKGPEPKDIAITICSDDAGAMTEILDRAADGQQCVWLENTVGEAQAVFRTLAARAAGAGIETGLLHSRFCMDDRATNEEKWTRILGKNGGAERYACGRILVGTQVLEQSLDIDADFMITRICPTDLILQRLGRLWRHNRSNRPANASQECVILAPPLAYALTAPLKAFGSSARVYSPYVLGRSLEIWDGLKHISLPGDIRFLLENTHSQRSAEPSEAMSLALKDQNFQMETMIRRAFTSIADLASPMSDSTAETRLINVETVPILIIETLDLQNSICHLPGESLHLSPKPCGPSLRHAATRLSMRLLHAPAWHAPEPAESSIQALLAPCLPDAKAGILRVICVDQTGCASSPQGFPHKGLYYDRKVGYYNNTNDVR